MGVPRFYVEGLAGRSVRLSEDDAIHAARVRRLSVGEEVIVFDGAGHEAAGRIVILGRSSAEVAYESIVQRRRPVPVLTLAVALPKGPRQDVLIEKCTELGTAGIVPLMTERSVSLASGHKLDRWRKTAIEAAKQSGQAWLPEFHAPERLVEAVKRVPAHELAVVAAPAEAGRGRLFGDRDCAACASILAFVGPEGGWTQGEMELLMSSGCQRIGLGPNILRIETAAIALAAMVHAAQRDTGETSAPD